MVKKLHQISIFFKKNYQVRRIYFTHIYTFNVKIPIYCLLLQDSFVNVFAKFIKKKNQKVVNIKLFLYICNRKQNLILGIYTYLTTQ